VEEGFSMLYRAVAAILFCMAICLLLLLCNYGKSLEEGVKESIQNKCAIRYTFVNEKGE